RRLADVPADRTGPRSARRWRKPVRLRSSRREASARVGLSATPRRTRPKENLTLATVQEAIDSRARPRMQRGAATWYACLLLGFFTFTLTIQGNVLPFLKAELDLSYAAASLHSSAIAAGMIIVGLVGERVARRLGRAPTLHVAALAVVIGC